LTFTVPGSEVETPVVWLVLFGPSEYDRSFHVICGLIASMRGSTYAAANWIWPP